MEGNFQGFNKDIEVLVQMVKRTTRSSSQKIGEDVFKANTQEMQVSQETSRSRRRLVKKKLLLEEEPPIAYEIDDNEEDQEE